MANHHMTDKSPIPFTAKEEIEWVEKEAIADKKRKEEMVEYERVKYQRDRKESYPSIPEQLDMLWHAIDLDTLDKTSDFYNNLKAVKEKYPKE
jgi:4-hydroxyphenylpyruvate dioxygenase-like putative hemolysin